MGSRHKAIKASLSVGSAVEWNDDHLDDFTLNISESDLIVGKAIADEWDTSETSGGSAPVWALVGAAGSGHSCIVLNTGATTGKLSSMRHMLGGAASNITSPDDLPVLNIAVDIAAVHTAGNVAEWGFFASATAPFTANAAGAYFRVNNNLLYAVVGNGAAETATLIGAFSQYGNYRIIFNSTNIVFYVDDMAAAAATITTTRPAVDLTIKASVISANNVDSTLRCDALSYTRLRKQ